MLHHTLRAIAALSLLCIACTSTKTPAASSSSSGSDDIADGSVKNGGLCKTDDNCESGQCAARNGAKTTGICVEECGDTDKCTHGGKCFPEGNPQALCSEECSGTSDCDKGLVCARYTEGSICDTDPVLENGATEGEKCSLDGKCPGTDLRCADDNKCRPACETSTDCSANSETKSYRCCNKLISTGAFIGACFPSSEVPEGFNCEDL